MKRAALAMAGCACLAAWPAQAHHGVAAIGFSDPEGPGVGIETTAALTLPRWLGFAMVKTELVSFQTRSDRLAFPAQKDVTVFNTAALGFGITPWLSAYVFQPYNVKYVDGGVGTDAGMGDTNLMLALGFKWDEGLRLIPQKESLDELRDWHFLAWASCTLPVGPTENLDDQGQPFEPDTQIGFGAPSLVAGLAALKQVSTDVTALGDVSYQYFVPHTYSFTRYQFGAEWRANGTVVYRAYGKGRVRVDVLAELGELYVARDRARDSSGAMVGVPGAGGNVLYGSLGARAYLGRFAFGLGIKRPLLTNLNDQATQQGVEGLENFRLGLMVSATAPL